MCVMKKNRNWNKVFSKSRIFDQCVCFPLQGKNLWTSIGILFHEFFSFLIFSACAGNLTAIHFTMTFFLNYVCWMRERLYNHVTHVFSHYDFIFVLLKEGFNGKALNRNAWCINRKYIPLIFVYHIRIVACKFYTPVWAYTTGSKIHRLD